MAHTYVNERRDTVNQTSEEAGSAIDTRLLAEGTTAALTIAYTGDQRFPGQDPLDTRGTDS